MTTDRQPPVLRTGSSYDMIELSDGVYGLYLYNGYRNDYGTPLYFKGSLDECIEEYLRVSRS